MAEVLAQAWVLSVGGSYDLVAGQRDGSMSLSMSPVDVTNKDSNNRRELIAAVSQWTFTASGLAEEGDTGFDALWTAWNTNASLACRYTTPSSATFTGVGYLSAYDLSGPFNDAFVFSLTLEGTATLTKA